MIYRKIDGRLNELNERIQNCSKCELCKLPFNKKDVSKGFGKLYGWRNCNKECRFLFLGMNPSHRRFEGHEYAFGGTEGSSGPGEKFNTLLKETGVFEEIFVDNLIHCSSETNTINKTWARNCFEFLLTEINILKPNKIITMGRQVFEIISSLFIEFNIKIDIENVWHPSYVFSYQRASSEQYKQMVLKACKGRI